MKITEFGTCLICCKKPCQCKTSEQVWNDACRIIQPLQDFNENDYSHKEQRLRVLWDKVNEIITKINDKNI